MDGIEQEMVGAAIQQSLEESGLVDTEPTRYSNIIMLFYHNVLIILNI